MVVIDSIGLHDFVKFYSQWEAKVERCEEEFQKISKVIKTEFEQFENNRIKEFKLVVTSYLEALARHQVQVNIHKEQFRFGDPII